MFLNFSFLLENTAIDIRNMHNITGKLSSFINNKVLNCYLYYFLSLKLKILFLCNLKNNQKPYLYSIDKFFMNANWLERETSEMYGILYYLKLDIRKLLLDYSKLDNPLLKDFSVNGVQDVFYNFFENQISVNKVEIIEL